jgi:hypothetical protein
VQQQPCYRAAILDLDLNLIYPKEKSNWNQKKLLTVECKARNEHNPDLKQICKFSGLIYATHPWRLLCTSQCKYIINLVITSSSDRCDNKILLSCVQTIFWFDTSYNFCFFLSFFRQSASMLKSGDHPY